MQAHNIRSKLVMDCTCVFLSLFILFSFGPVFNTCVGFIRSFFFWLLAVYLSWLCDKLTTKLEYIFRFKDNYK